MTVGKEVEFVQRDWVQGSKWIWMWYWLVSEPLRSASDETEWGQGTINHQGNPKLSTEKPTIHKIRNPGTPHMRGGFITQGSMALKIGISCGIQSRWQTKSSTLRRKNDVKSPRASEA